jgi:hypothetical protein
MNVQLDSQPSIVEEGDVATRRPRMSRRAVPVGVALLAATVFGVSRFGDDDTERPVVAKSAAASDRSDYTRAQTLVQQSIDAALTANQSDYTRAQVTIQRYIDEALDANGS